MVGARTMAAVSKILAMQILIVAVVASGFFLWGTGQSFISSLLGGVVAIIPNLYFALKVSSSTGQDAKKVVRTFYVGESAKLILTAVMFFLVFQWPEIEIMPLMVGYIAALTVFWFALIIRL
ncbi:MAG: F0F1 ATP synthase assembly protein I [Methylococcales bacterium]|jgi:ATP synthase protein I|nr:F0F1 ATP synthase assembly protein I [Methylococcales bacterium]MDG2365360.1 ATP synthase subunit I [Methylococcaceae bacterium]MBT3506335.1 F0F1 ATP synthase assembly protein I [Methylococcales bacterium]MBT3699128.1 F0F1 ATP synthase assembly protein I [Methylococcales bacterium]MBT3815191.1 F0F1 ATP synthase assembly protein I [Methylococcales bacterium]